MEIGCFSMVRGGELDDRRLTRRAAIVGAAFAFSLFEVHSQTASAGTGAPAKSDPKLPVTALDEASPLFLLPTVDAVLGAFVPPARQADLGKGNDLLLDFPDVVAAGKVEVRLVSTVPRTDGLWLLTLQPNLTKGALLAGYSVGAAAPSVPDIKASVVLTQTQTLMFVARSLGKYYAVRRQIKVGAPVAAGARSK